MDDISREPLPEPLPPPPPERLRDIHADPEPPAVFDEAAMSGTSQSRIPSPEPGDHEGGEEEEPLAAGADATLDEPLADAPEITDAAELSRVVLAALLASRDAVSFLRLAQVCNSTQALVKDSLAILQQDLLAARMPCEVAIIGDSARVLTSPSMFPYLQRLKVIKRQERLTPAAIETLAVIAYKQPVIRAEVESIRGVKAGPMLRTLLDHKLIRIKGRRDVPGRPLEYETTQHFLERFGIGSLRDLPSIREFKAIGG